MNTKTIRRFFPDSQAGIVHQNGSHLAAPIEGVEVVLHTRQNDSNPCCAEVISGTRYAEIGLSFEGKELSDFDGVFFLPREVGKVLTDAGYTVHEDCFA